MDTSEKRRTPPARFVTHRQAQLATLLPLVLPQAFSPVFAQNVDTGTSLLREAGLQQKHTLALGGTFLDADATVLAASDRFDPIAIDLDDIGVEDSYDSFFLEYRYRLTSRWSTFLGAYRFSGSGGRVLARDFNFAGVEFSTGAEVDAELTADVFMVDVLYSVYESDTLEVQLGGGLHAFDLDASIEGSLFIGDASVETSSAAESLLAPIPNFRGAASWALTPELGVTLVGGWLSANIDNYRGDFSYLHLRGHYSLSERLGVSLGYLSNEVDVTEARARGDLVYDVVFDGPSVTFTYAF